MQNKSIPTPRMWKNFFLILVGLTTSCCVPRSQSYNEFYCHLNNKKPFEKPTEPCSDYFLVILVDARHLDYTDNYSFLKTMRKHPSDGSKNGDVGHAWVYLQGRIGQQTCYLEGGHSGELGLFEAKYFDGIMNYLEFGSPKMINGSCQYTYEPNPVKYLWSTLHDGFFQPGCGKHTPTYAARVDLTETQFRRILQFIYSYNYSEYALTGNQCSSFVAQLAALAGLDLECEMTIHLEPQIFYGNMPVRFWEDTRYEYLTIASPDILERSLIFAVNQGRASNALPWYYNSYRGRR